MNEQGPNQEEPETVPQRLLKTGEALVDEEEVVVAEVNGLAYPDGVLVEIAWRYNKYFGLKRDHERLQGTIREYADRLRPNVEAAEEYDDSEGERNFSGALQILRTEFPDVLEAGDADQSRDIVDDLRTLEEENERLRDALQTVRRGLKLIADRTESTATREDAHQAIIEIADALDGGGDEE